MALIVCFVRRQKHHKVFSFCTIDTRPVIERCTGRHFRFQVAKENRKVAWRVGLRKGGFGIGGLGMSHDGKCGQLN
jgi:hypothetical protein